MYQPDLFEDKVVPLPTARTNPRIRNFDEFVYANGARVILKAADGMPLDLQTAVFLCEYTKSILLKNFG